MLSEDLNCVAEALEAELDKDEILPITVDLAATLLRAYSHDAMRLEALPFVARRIPGLEGADLSNVTDLAAHQSRKNVVRFPNGGGTAA